MHAFYIAYILDPWTLALFAGLACLVLGIAIGYYSLRMSLGPRLSQLQQSSRKEVERAGQLERERLRAIYNLIGALTSTLNYQRVLEIALDLSNSALNPSNAPEDRLVSAVLLFSKNTTSRTELSVGSARRFTPTDMRIALPGRGGLIGRVIEVGTPQILKTIPKDPELSRIVALRACNAAYCLPLRAGLDTYGVLLFAHPSSDFFTTSRRELLDIIVSQAVIAIQNARLYSDLEQEKERMMEIQEEARKKLARDLHDGPTQSVAAIAMRVNFARRLLDRDLQGAADELYKVEDLARRTTQEIRHMLFTLRPLVLESQGLVAALEAMAEKMHDTYNQNVLIEAEQSVVPKLEMSKQAVIFYIAEEAVNNARKHAQAVHIWVRLKPLDEDVTLLEIEDDGVGFNLGAVDASYEQRGSLGMVNMRERAELINGILHIDSAEGKGTRIQVVIPLSEEASDRLRRGG